MKCGIMGKIIMVKETGSWFSTINHKLNMKREA
jgi:hypothetical protein